MKWAYGVTTVPARSELLGRTLRSLAAAGFDHPRVFDDGEGVVSGWAAPDGLVTCHYPKVRAFGNFALGLWELLIRFPDADRYVMFQDDLVAVKNLRPYLEASAFPLRGYLNLYTFAKNEQVIAGEPTGRWYEGALHSGYHQVGMGALGLVFSQEGLIALLSSPSFVRKPLHMKEGVRVGHRNIDGAVATAMNNCAYREYVHNPSLLRHTGLISQIRTDPSDKSQHCPWASDLTFPGEDFDATVWLRSSKDTR